MIYTDVFGNNTLPPSEYGYAGFTLTGNVTFVWPYNTNNVTYTIAKVMDIVCAAGNTLTLPDAREVSTGEDFLIRNTGPHALTVKDAGGTQISTVAAGAATYFYLTNNTTLAGTYGVIDYGVGTSTADAGSLVGYGIKAIGASLNQSHPVVPANSGINIGADYRAKLVVFTGGADSFTLDSAITLGDDYFVLFRNDGTGTATLNPNGAETIDGMPTLQVQPSESLMLICTGSQWYSVGYGRSTQYQFTQLTLDVSAGGTITLSAAEASNKLIQFIGNPSATVTVIIPAVVSVYYTQSQISTAQNVLFKTASGTGVTLPQGSRIIALCDGTNVVSAQSVASNTAIALIDGSALVPAISFASQTNTGLFKSGIQDLGVSVNGSSVAVFGSTGIQSTTVGPNSTNRHTLPAVTSDTVTLNAATQTLTNKTISGNSNTLSNIGNSSLTNSSITINGNSVALGGSTTVTAVNPNALTIGTGLSGTSYNGSSPVTVAIDNTVATLTGSQTLTNKTVNLANNTLSGTKAEFNAALSDGDFATTAGTETLTNKTIALGSNTVSGSMSQFNTALTDADFVYKDSATGAATLPAGTDAQRPSAAAGMFRLNTTRNVFEGYDGAIWGEIGGTIGEAREVQVATAGQTVFTITSPVYLPNNGSLRVYINGLLQEYGIAYVENPTNVTFGEPLQANDEVTFIFNSKIGIGQDSAYVDFIQAGTGAVVRTAQDKMREVVSVTDFMTAKDIVDIQHGTESSGVLAAVKKAIAHINIVGGELYFPPGHYKAPYPTSISSGDWIEITKSGVSLVATPGSVTLENFLLYIHGSYGYLQLVGAAGFTSGSTQINTASAHGLVAGDYVQMLSGYNAGSTDAGYFQMESQNPTYLDIGEMRLSEIHRIASVDSSTTASLFDSVIYPDYVNNTSGQTSPLRYVSISNGGSGYTNNETVNITSASGSATGRAVVSSGTIASVFLTSQWSGSVDGESVSITAADGSGSGSTGVVHFVPGAQIRKLAMVENVSFVGFEFKNESVSSFSGLMARCVFNLKFDRCHFSAGTLPGTHFKCTDCLGITFNQCTSYRNPQSVTGSSWNSFLIAGGSQDIVIENCRFVGESQTIDFTPTNLQSPNPGDTTDAVLATQTSVQNILVGGCLFSDCSNPVTTHPGCYNFTFTDNKLTNCQNGVLVRSLKNNIADNTIATNGYGIVISGFYHDTLVSGNNISDVKGAGVWSGVYISPMTSELMNNNDVQSVVIDGNVFHAKYASGSRDGVLLRHYGNGVPVAGFSGFTDTIKTSISDYKISNNKFYGCTSRAGKYINGVEISGNTFCRADGVIVAYYINFDQDSAAGYIVNNRFIDNNAAAISISGFSGALTFPYEHRHVIGTNSGKVVMSQSFNADDVINDRSFQKDTGTYTPTLGNFQNVSSSTAYQCQYMRVGDIVSVSLHVSITATALTTTTLSISLPVPSNFSQAGGRDGAGIAYDFSGNQIAKIQADATTDLMQLWFAATTTSAREFVGTFQYIVR